MSDIIEVTDQDFKGEVLESETPVLVDFWAPWCHPCRMMAPVLDSLAKKLSPGLKIVKLNTDSNKKTASLHNVQGIPCFILFVGGREIERIVGFTPELLLEEKLKAHDISK